MYLSHSNSIVRIIHCIPFIFFSATGADLWKSVTSVSNAGKKRGRGRLAGKGLTKNLNMGQIIGEGRNRLVLPGLNTQVKQGSVLVKQEKGISDPTW